MGWAGRLLVGLVAVVLSLGAASAAVASGTHRGQCEQLWPTDGREGVTAPAADGRITVPVIVRYMKHREPQHARPVRQAFPRQKIEQLFGRDGRAGEVNDIWRQAGIRLFVYRIEECRYGLKDFGRQSETEDTSLDSCEDLFQRVNRAYAFGNFGLDLYIWYQLYRGGFSIGGYASCHRAGEPLLGAVWLTSECPRACAQLVAHEIGHFLGLCHQCFTEDRRPAPCRESMCQTPPTRRCADPDVDRHLLMRGDHRGRLLTPGEVQAARRKASDRAHPSTP